MLAASASILALGVVSPAQALAADPGVRQEDSGTIAINLYELDLTDPEQVSGVVTSVSDPSGPAVAIAEVLCAETATCSEVGAVEQSAIGTQSASNGIDIDGSHTIRAEADAYGTAASAIGYIDLAVGQLAVAPELATNDISIGGLLDVHASADAHAITGGAFALAGVGTGMWQVASAGYDGGTANNSISIDGDLVIAANALAQADNGYATAGAFVGIGIYQEANGVDSASNSLMNAGEISIGADAKAVAGNDFALAIASGTGIVQVASAHTQNIANSTQSGGTLVGVSNDTPSGPATAQITNVGQLGVGFSAHAAGQADASAIATGSGIVQLAFGDDSLASLNNFGSIDIGAAATATGVGTPRAIATVGGIAQVATAVALTTVETIHPYGTATLNISAVPMGVAAVSLSNSGDIAIHADVNVHAAASESGSATEAFGYAAVAGIAQTAVGLEANAFLGNGGSLLISAAANAESEGIANAQALADGIDQVATALSVQQTAVFASGTTTPSFFTTSTQAVGDAAVALANGGTLTVVAVGDGLADGTAYVGASANGINQIALGKTASASLTNTGTLATLSKAHAVGELAFAGAGAVGATQAAGATSSAIASMANSGTFLVSAWGQGFGEVGGFANASAIGVVQQASASGVASVDFLNSGFLSVQGLATGTGGTSAAAFARVSGVQQDVYGPAGAATFTNDGLLRVMGEVHATAGDYATAAATVMAGVTQFATVGTAGAGDLSVINNGTIEVGALAQAEGDIDAYATAVILGGSLQTVTGGGGAIEFDNNGTLEVLAMATANAVGDYQSDVAFANALAYGNFAKVGPYVTVTTGTGTGTQTGTTAIVGVTAVPGAAAIEMTNDGALHVGALAHAAADGNAYAFATALYGLVAVASAAGEVDITLANSGDLTVMAKATAEGGHAATANAAAIGAFIAAANATGTGDAHAIVDNSGTVIVRADAHADATTNAWAAALGVTAVWEVAQAAEGDASVGMVNNGTIDVIANAVATGLVAQASAQGGAGGIFGGAILQSAAAYSGNAYGSFENAGEISVVANASAYGSVIAYAAARAGPGITQRVGSGGVAVADVGNSGSLSVVAHAMATATNSALSYVENLYGVFVGATGVDQATVGFDNGGYATIAAVAEAYGPAWGTANAVLGRAVTLGVRANDGDANNHFTNSGSFAVAASAIAEGEFAAASAAVMEGMVQLATAVGGDAFASFDNSGDISFFAHADAATSDADGYGTALAQATVYNAIAQQGLGMAQTTPSFVAGNASVELRNSGTIEIGVRAEAEGEAVGNANATLSGGLVQRLFTGQLAPAYSSAPDILGSATLSNDGYVTMVASAEAVGSSAVALADVIAGISQAASAALGDVSLNISNDGSIVIHAGADASGGELFSRANATVYGAFVQSADASTGSASVGFNNTDKFQVTAGAKASGEQLVFANANATGGLQEAFGGKDGIAVASFDNGGDYIVHAAAQATLTPAEDATGFTFLNAAAGASGLYQYSDGGSVSFTNSGTFDIAAGAQSKGPTANVFATALGVSQGVSGPDGQLNFANEGDFKVAAGAKGDGEDGTGFVVAAGYRGIGESLSADISNGGDMSVIANIETPGGAIAGAAGIALIASVATSAPDMALLDGSLENSGDLKILALASAGTVMTGTGTTAHEVPGSSANATGIAMISGVNTMTVTNSGSIAVDAVTGHGGVTGAYGIRATGNGTGAPAGETDILTINNSGDIIVRMSGDGGETWQRGMAIDVSQAPNASVINLLGGSIYGNVDIKDGDAIVVAEGETSFDGIINPEFLPSDDEEELAAVALDPEIVGEGDLTIADGATLYLRNGEDGPSYAFVDTLTVEEGGTLAIEIVPGATEPGSYVQVFADTATLEGTLEARLQAGLYDDMVLDNVIDANVLNGDFEGDRCVLGGGDLADSLFFSIDCVKDSAANIDIRIDRTEFDEIAGLDGNARSAAEGLECIYDPDLTGGVADLITDLFLITDAGDYNAALHMLAGESYAQYLQSFQSLGVHYNDILDRATNCEIPALAGSAIECRASAPLHIWGQFDHQERKVDGDSEAGDYKASRTTGIMGIDANFANHAIVGATLGKVGNDLNDRRFGDDIDAEGWQVGLYGVYDSGPFYVKAMGTYSKFDGDSRRRINLAPFGGTFVDVTEGDPDVTTWTLGIHAGARMPMGDASVITPYLNLDYVDARLDEFIERGDGANLHLGDSSEGRAWMTVGAKWATQLGGVVPEFDLGYRYRFGDSRSKVEAAFDCQIQSCGFDVVSSSDKRGTFLAGLSVGGKVGRVDLRIGYQGEYNGDVTSHAGNFRITVPLGKRAAPSLPPAVPASPPPPPVVEEPAQLPAAPEPPAITPERG